MIFLLALLACRQDVQIAKVAVDADGDGYTDAVDCDDGLRAVHPEADETCDGLDDDCDGEVDEDATDAGTWYADADADGYGDADAPIAACEPAAGYVADATDCDDADADIHPGAPEPDCTDPVDYDCDGSVGYADLDADGWPACEDCDDTQSAVNPDAAETCNTLDDDCDALVDDDDPDLVGGSTWYGDADGDGYGSDASVATACDAPSGFVAVAGDCDDLDGARNPSSTEVCDDADADEDCSGLADDADAGTDASTFTTFGRDGDSDGYGDPTRTVSQCDAPSGYVLDVSDCDDAEAGTHPGAAEICDGVDQDCDGSVDEGLDSDGDGVADCDDTEVCDGVDNDGDGLVDDADPDVTGTSPWYADADADGYGAGAAAAACTAPSGTVAGDTDCDDAAAGTHPGASEHCDEVDEDCDGAVDNDAIDEATGYLDADGDGYAGTAVIACELPSGAGSSSEDCDDGDATVSPGASETCEDGVDQDCDGIDAVCPPDTELTESDAFARIREVAASMSFPADLELVGDVNGDGADDLLAVSYNASVTRSGQGAAYLFHGPLSGDYTVGDADAALVGEAAGDTLQEAARAGDLDGDGYADLAVGSYLAAPRGYPIYEGGAWVVYGPATGTVDLAVADAEIYGGADYRYAGRVLEGLGDVDGDGIDDLAMGGVGGSSANDYLSIFYGAPPASTSVLGGDVVLTGATSTDGIGPVAGGSDLDGDGTIELVIGAPLNGDGARYGGSVYVVSAPFVSGRIDIVAERQWTGDSFNEYLGVLVAAPGDLDGDGYDEIVVSNSPEYTTYVVYGQSTLPTSGNVTSVASAAITIVSPVVLRANQPSGAGDVDGDGDDELLVTDCNDSTWGTYRGQVGLFDAPVGSLTEADAEYVFYGDADRDFAGVGRGGADLSGDGLPDIGLGVYGDDAGGSGAGAVWLFEL